MRMTRRALNSQTGSSRQAIKIRRQLRAQGAGDEYQLVVRVQLAQPVEGAAINQWHVLAARSACADHESQSIIVVVGERLEYNRRSAHAAGDALAEGLALRGRENLEDAIRKGVAMLLEPVQCADVRLDMLGQ